MAEANWTATGTFRYRDRLQDLTGYTGATADRPARFARVEVVRSPNTTLAVGNTDGSGNFSIPVVDNQTATVFVRVITIGAAGYNLRVQSTPTSTTTYAVAGANVVNHNPNTNTDFGTVVALAGAGGEGFNILDALVDGSDYAATLLGGLPGSTCTAVWSSTSTTGTFYSGGTIRLLADEGWDDSVIQHEHGHFIDLNFSASDSPGGVHFLGDNNQDLRLAWGEGVATYHMSAGRRTLGRGQPNWYIDCTTGSGAGNLNFSYEIEGPSISATGAASEISVQSLLYDIVDAAGDADDTPGVDDDPLSRPHGAVWTVMDNYIPTAANISLEDFWDGWFSPGINNGFQPQMEATFGGLGVEFYPDPLESDNSAAQARSIVTTGVPQHHTFYGVGDADWAAFVSPGPATRFIVETANLVGDANTNLEIYDTNGTTLLATNDNRSASDPSSLLNWNAPAAGTYFARLTHTADLGVYGSFDLRVLRGNPTGLTFAELAPTAGVDGSRPGRGCAWGDFDGDGDADLFVSCAAGNTYYLYRNNGNATFTEIAASAGVLGAGASGQGACWGDYDNDGDLDLFVPTVGTNILYRNNGNATFTNVAAAAGVAYTGAGSIGGSWCDYNRDGRLDLFVGTFAAGDLLYRANANGTFTEVAAALGVAGDAVDTFGGSWCDYDRDGWTDIFVHHDGAPNHLYHNNAGLGFTDATPAVMIEPDVRSWGATWADDDHDGDFDLFVSNLGSPCRLYRYTGGGAFSEMGGAAGVAAGGSQTGNCIADFDNDLDEDIYVTVYDQPNLYYENVTGAAYFNNPKAADALQGRGTATADYDRDGDVDLFVVNSNGPFRLYQTGGLSNAWLRLKLVGITSNRAAIGARVTWRSRGLRQIRQISGGGGYVSQDDQVLAFGLGQSAGPDTFDIVWPSGAFQRVTGLPRNTTQTITEVTSFSGVEPGAPLAPAAQLLQNRPNPFNPVTRIAFRVAAAGPARLDVFDTQGRLVRTLLDAPVTAGEHEVAWDGLRGDGGAAPSGVYLYRLSVPGAVRSRKMILQR